MSKLITVIKEEYLKNKYNTLYKLSLLSNKTYKIQFPLPGYDGLAWGFDMIFKTKKAAIGKANE